MHIAAMYRYTIVIKHFKLPLIFQKVSLSCMHTLNTHTHTHTHTNTHSHTDMYTADSTANSNKHTIIVYLSCLVSVSAGLSLAKPAPHHLGNTYPCIILTYLPIRVHTLYRCDAPHSSLTVCARTLSVRVRLCVCLIMCVCMCVCSGRRCFNRLKLP